MCYNTTIMKNITRLVLLSLLSSTLIGCSSSPTPKPIFECTFDSRESVVTPAMGPAAKSVTNEKLEFVEGLSGKALRVPAGGPIALYDFAPDFLGGKGCVEFWAKILNSRPNYGCADPSFYCIKYANGEENLIQFTANNGAGCSGLYGRMIHNERVTRKGWGGHCPYTGILGDKVHDWHHYAIVWNVEGVTGYRNAQGESVQAVLYVDGKPHIDHNLMRGKDNAAMLLRTAAKPSVLGFPLERGSSQSEYLIDDFKIWDFDKVPAPTEFLPSPK